MSGEKTEQPTEKKIQDQAEKGQTPQRKNIIEALVVTTGILLLFSMFATFKRQLEDLFEVVFIAIEGDMAGASRNISLALRSLIQSLLVVVLPTGIMALFSNLLLNKFNFAPKALEPKISKMNPVSTLKGIFSITTVYNFIRMLILFLGIATIISLVLWTNTETILAATFCGARCLANIFPKLLTTIVTLVVLLMLLLAAFDFQMQTAIFKKQNKMTKDEVKREHKGQEGDPEVKGRRRQLTQEDAVMPSPRDATHLVFGNGFAVSLIFSDGSPPFIVAKYRSNKLDQTIAMYRRFGVACVNSPREATSFHRWFPMYSEAGARAAPGMAKILEATGAI